MISLYDAVSLSKRKMIFIFILLVLMWSFMIYLVFQDQHDVLLLSMKIAGILLSFILSWILIDMTHPFEMMIRSFKSSSYLFIHKWFQVVIWSFLLSITTMIILLFGVLLYEEMISISIFLSFMLHLFLDLVIIGSIVIIISKIKHPTLALFIPLIYTTYQLFVENKQSLSLYYIIPFFQPMMIHYSLAILYKLCYISLGLLIANFPYKKHTF